MSGGFFDFIHNQVSSLRSQLECWNIGTLEYWVLGLRLRFQPVGLTGRRVESTAQRENGKLGYCKIPLDDN